MRAITLRELRGIKDTGLTYLAPFWKEEMIRDFAKMKSQIYSLKDAVEEVILRISIRETGNNKRQGGKNE